MPSGSFDLQVRAVNRAGEVSSASMTAAEGDAVIAWINTMNDAIRADPSNVGLASRTMAMVSAAVYDAVNDIERTDAVFHVDVHAPRWASRLHHRLGARLRTCQNVRHRLDRPLLAPHLHQPLIALNTPQRSTRLSR
jgi:hypothetical protein